MSDARYEVLTWDMDRQRFTPQVGVSRGPYQLMELRGPLRQLRRMGYDATRSDGVSILVRRVAAEPSRCFRFNWITKNRSNS